MPTNENGITAEMMEQLTVLAGEVAGHAYAPYSRFRVGAALLLNNGKIVTGTNVENASYGLTICAERSAIVRAVAEHGPEVRILACAVTNLNDAASPPCGACLQVLSEFMEPEGPMIMRGKAGWDRMPFAELLPFRFKLLP
jgi:cytidine deaminase